MTPELASSLSDFVIAAECAVFAALVWRRDRAFAALFACAGMAALLGGVNHGFFEGDRAVYARIWDATVLAVGGAAWAGWILAARRLGWPARPVAIFAAADFAIYAPVVLFVHRKFYVAIANYVVPTLLLTVAFAIGWRERGARFGFFGLLLTFAAAAVQTLQLGPWPDATYHGIQAAGFALLFLAARSSG